MVFWTKTQVSTFQNYLYRTFLNLPNGFFFLQKLWFSNGFGSYRVSISKKALSCLKGPIFGCFSPMRLFSIFPPEHLSETLRLLSFKGADFRRPRLVFIAKTDRSTVEILLRATWHAEIEQMNKSHWLFKVSRSLVDRYFPNIIFQFCKVLTHSHFFDLKIIVTEHFP